MYKAKITKEYTEIVFSFQGFREMSNFFGNCIE